MYPEDCIGLYKVYLNTKEEPHGYLILDLTQDKNDGLRFRANLFQTDKYPITFYSDIGDEACEIELSKPTNAQDG